MAKKVSVDSRRWPILGLLKLPLEDELLTVDQQPMENPDCFFGGAGARALGFTPATLTPFRNSFPSLFRSFSFRFSISSWELALAHSPDWWAYGLQC